MLVAREEVVDPAAFEIVAADYDADFSHTALGRILRKRVWRRLGRCFSPGQQVLELACGTGEDACWLAARGVRVTATDGATGMIQITEKKARRAGLGDLIVTQRLSLQDVTACRTPFAKHHFDGMFSNFGGINTINDWPDLAKGLSGLIKPGGLAVLVPMGPVCPWEVAWHLLHGQPKEAFRRLTRSSAARIGDDLISVWYPSAGQLRKAFAPWFKPVAVESLGLWLPPSYLGNLLARWPSLWISLSGFEAASAWLTGDLGDHYILILERNHARS